MTEPTSSSSPSLPAKRLGLAVPLAVIAVVAVGGWALWPQIEPLLSQAQPVQAEAPQKISPLMTELEQIKGELEKLQAETKTVPDHFTVEERLSKLEKSSADAASVLRLVDRVDRLEASIRDLQGRRKADAALVLALGLLKEAVDRGAPFDTELRALKALAPDDGDIKKVVADLKPRAAAGIPSRVVLIGRFAALEGAVIRADSLPARTDGLVDDWRRRSLERVLALFTLRREDGEIDGTSTPAIVARARDALDRGDWADGVHQLEGLNGEAAKAAQLWLDDARARLLADRDIADLAADAVAAAGAKL